MYRSCYSTCQSCSGKGDSQDHKCSSCKSAYPKEILNSNNNKNCYTQCNFYYYFDNENNYHCTEDASCPENYSKLLEDKGECIKKNAQESEVIKQSEEINNINNNSLSC